MEENPISKINALNLTNRISLMKAQFEKGAQEMIRTIPENVFVAHFLPVFAGESNDNVEYKIAKWYEIAGNNYSPVNVVDANGMFVIQVPPLHDQNAFKPVTDRNVSLDYIFNLVKQKSSVSPMLGNNILNSEMYGRANAMVNNEDTGILDRWERLLRHYGKWTGGNKPAASAHSTEDEFEY